jgi:hypothetical protein
LAVIPLYQNIAAMQLQTKGYKAHSADILIIIVESPFKISRIAAIFFYPNAISQALLSGKKNGRVNQYVGCGLNLIIEGNGYNILYNKAAIK